jgi:uncharacterized protein YyaL (SSP411 family)
VEGGISRYTVDDSWIIPHFEKMLYDNTQFILLLSKYCKINNDKYFKEKLEQTIEFLRTEFLNDDKLLGSAYDADSEGEEGKYYVYKFDEIKDINHIHDYFDVSSSGNWEKKNILVEKKKPPKEILDKLFEIRKKRKKPFFDNKSQLDLNCLWISSLVSANEVLPEKKYLNLAEEFFSTIEEKYLKKNIQHSYSKEIVFLEDYAFLINSLNDLSDKTMNFIYKNYAKKICNEAFSKFYVKKKDIFQKNQKDSNDIFFNPIDIGDNTIPNGNAIMLINLVRLGKMNEAKILSNSLNGYLNIYKNHMMTAIRALDFFNNIKSGKNCTEQGCVINK